jgi:hypothetical protein
VFATYCESLMLARAPTKRTISSWVGSVFFIRFAWRATSWELMLITTVSSAGAADDAAADALDMLAGWRDAVREEGPSS